MAAHGIYLRLFEVKDNIECYRYSMLRNIFVGGCRVYLYLDVRWPIFEFRLRPSFVHLNALVSKCCVNWLISQTDTPGGAS